jgi:ABC-2 type transport system permease protein
MIDHLLLVAAREFRQIAGTRGFWITLLILPLAIAAGPIIGRFLDKSDTQRVMLIDRSGREAAAIRRRIELEHQRDVLAALSRYAERHHLDAADPQALWAQHGRWYADADVAQFIAAGGAQPALARMKRVAKPDTPAFDPPDAATMLVPTPPAIAAAPPAQLDALLKPYLHPADKNAKPISRAAGWAFGCGRTAAPRPIWSS